MIVVLEWQGSTSTTELHSKITHVFTKIIFVDMKLEKWDALVDSTV